MTVEQPALPRPAARADAWRSVRTPAWAVPGVARLVGAGLLLMALTGSLPWRQTAVATGKVMAYVPAERQQLVDAPIGGRVVTWHVREGQTVRAGDLLVELRDNDALLQDRLRDERGLVESQLDAAISKVSAAEAKIIAALTGREAAVLSAEAKLRSAEDKLRAEQEVLVGAEAALTTAEIQLARTEALAAEGLRSVQDLENARLRMDTARAKREETRAKVDSVESDLQSALGELDKARAEADGKLAGAQGDMQLARSDESDYRAKLLSIDTKIARQDAQVVLAPVDGVVAKVFGGQGGEQVRQADPLVQLVPDTLSRAVALHVDGSDVRFVRVGDPVRLQFEGWPALQVAGWPNVAVGTFAGSVDFIDTIDDGKGGFRVMVVPAEPWPDGALLRQGVKANGWVLLGQVPLAYEVWRRFNDFPPEIEPREEKKDLSELDPVEKGKAGKAWKK